MRLWLTPAPRHFSCTWWPVLGRERNEDKKIKAEKEKGGHRKGGKRGWSSKGLPSLKFSCRQAFLAAYVPDLSIINSVFVDSLSPSPSPPLDNIWVMMIVWGLRRNIMLSGMLSLYATVLPTRGIFVDYWSISVAHDDLHRLLTYLHGIIDVTADSLYLSGNWTPFTLVEVPCFNCCTLAAAASC